MLSKAQKKLIDELSSGRIIYEDRFGCCLSYGTAKITEIPHGYILPRRVNKQTVWVLISLDLIETITVWDDHPNPMEVYCLSFKGAEITIIEAKNRVIEAHKQLSEEKRNSKS